MLATSEAWHTGGIWWCIRRNGDTSGEGIAVELPDIVEIAVTEATMPEGDIHWTGAGCRSRLRRRNECCTIKKTNIGVVDRCSEQELTIAMELNTIFINGNNIALLAR